MQHGALRVAVDVYKRQDNNAIAVAVAGLHQRPLLVVGNDYDFGFLSAGQGHGITGIIDQ